LVIEGKGTLGESQHSQRAGLAHALHAAAQKIGAAAPASEVIRKESDGTTTITGTVEAERHQSIGSYSITMRAKA
jgi:hypothetical protein